MTRDTFKAKGGQPDPPETAQHPTCSHCGSSNVSADAAVRWHDANQEWEVTSVFDGGHCDDCDAELKHFDWKDS